MFAMVTRSLLAALVCGLFLFGCGPSTATPPEGAPNILIISIDTLRADRLGVYGNDDWATTPTPAMDALADRGVVFDMATVPRGQTRPAIAAMLTGKFPITSGVRENGMFLEKHHRTFFEHLLEGGYQTGVFIANFERGTMGSEWAYRGAQQGVDGHGNEGRKTGPESVLQEQWDDRVERATHEFLRQTDPSRPFAAWVHFYDVHKPYNPPEGFDRYGQYADMPLALSKVDSTTGKRLHDHLDAISLGDRFVGPDELRRILGLYDGTVTATDVRVERILATLKDMGKEDETTIILTSDHGEELFDRNRYFYHGNSIHLGTLRVPLIIAGPGIPAGGRTDVPVMNLDLAPTILEMAGIATPKTMEGKSLLPILSGRSSAPPRPVSFYEWQDLIYGASDGTHFYIHNPEHVHPQKPPYWETGQSYAIACFEGYDLSTDPLQINNAFETLDPVQLVKRQGLPEDYRPLRAALFEWLADPSHERKLSWPGLTGPIRQAVQAEAERMAALGYVGMEAQGRDHLRLHDCAPPKER